MEINEELAYEIEDLSTQMGLSICASLKMSDDVHIRTIDDDRLYVINHNGIFEASIKGDLAGLSSSDLLKLEMHGELKEKSTLVIGKKIGKAVSAKQIIDVINAQ